MSDFDTIRLSLGLAEDVSDEDVAARVLQLQADAEAGAEAATELADRTFTDAFDAAVKASTMVPAQRDSARKLYDADPDSTIALMAAGQPAPPQAAKGDRGTVALDLGEDEDGGIDAEARLELAQAAERLADEKGISITDAAIQLTQGAAA